MTDYPRHFVDFIHLFNVERAFYDCHEYGEELWLEEGRPLFLKGLIQTAVSLYHLEGGNLGGARKLWRTASAYLSPYTPAYMGLDVERILQDMNKLFTEPGEPTPEQAATIRLHVVDPKLQDLLANWRVLPVDDNSTHSND
ncbi:DUF309 domain-containing protein [Kyrpidia tusciae]|uniref:DUF309 domain-containing protein n=1 Tax=Kyrpidia tusciae (strain DSM 2912 / NBRC 15312 / T2) TaxID=562970 RepID=D5WVA2_KYRT2|nr:DUF309 domain-containing protein [Kyrpidia tusciae]ADG05512.1 protein of unknown function DUF309 [Kyrpidia tusciae DSM 2912]